MANVPDLVRDSKLETYYLPDCTVETVHTYNEPEQKSRRRLVTRIEHWKRQKRNRKGCGGRSDKKVRAVKQIDISGRFRGFDYSCELEAITKFSQPRYERCFVKSLGWYDSPEYLLIAMEYLELGDLGVYLHRRPPLPEGQAQEIAYQILDGLNMMHYNGFAHRDLNPTVSPLFLDDHNHNLAYLWQNILIQLRPPDEWWIKISDFGISKRIEEAPSASTTLRGTWGYIAPEVHRLTERDTPFASDIWSLGQIVFELLTKEIAFKHLGSLVGYVTQADHFPTDRLSRSSALSVEFITSLMCPIPMTAAVAISNKWIQSKLIPSDSEANVSHTLKICPQ
ncbi:hypothetical protein N7517_008803 [Penicillium concentricum]|uniref:Autophagy-related protein 1 n=1 Tax=Penicillium concentricum TaxID=293559 RepID=A0A9W9RT10_9EURO|nr:uncharacterized protein N7517_008803 [Penicillium concentricum]KAJ5365917.1 hypothetical protein N7517_008803 [Penicillium concentricum]